MQLSSGDRVYGHVRRYYPHHNIAKARMDVGRRSERAMVILTRASGGNHFYNSLLKALDAISSHYHSTANMINGNENARGVTFPMETFLHQVHIEHAVVAKHFQSSLTSTNSLTPNFVTIGLKQLELNHAVFSNVDLTKFIIPASLLVLQQQQSLQSQSGSGTMSMSTSSLPSIPPSSADSLILPLLRCIGIAHTLRLLSALLCERRIVVISSSATKLSTCVNAVTSILSQGLLHWQHIFVPILPPSMFNFLAAPMPYLFGIMSQYGSPAQLEQIGGLGEVLAVYLDHNEFKTFGMRRPDLSIPEILSSDVSGMDPIAQQYQYGGSQPAASQGYSIADILKMHLLTIMKEDKKTRSSSLGKEGSSAAVATAIKGKDLIKKGFGKLKNAAKKKLLSVENSGSGDAHANLELARSSDNNDYNGEDPPGNESAVTDPIGQNELYTYNEGYNNEACEEDIRIAFTTFFLSYIGDMKQYLRPKPQGSGGGLPVFSKDLFLESRIKCGEYANSPMYKLSVHFKESQIFEQYAKARVEDIAQRRTFSPRISPLFNLAMQYHNEKRIPFQSAEVRSTVRHLAQNRPVKELISGVTHVRARAMALTSNSRDDSIAGEVLQRLVQECRECSIILVEVMSVVWDRLRDSKGMQWKHGLYALQIIQELILHGPIVAVAEVTDGLDKIRRMKRYDNSKRNAVQEIRNAAFFIYSILVNRSRLFAMRRVCAQRRKEMTKPIRYIRDPRIDVVKNKQLKICLLKFTKLHPLIRPDGIMSSTENDLLGVQTTVTSVQSPGFNSAGLAVPPPLVGESQPVVPVVPNELAPVAPAQKPSLINMMGGASITAKSTATGYYQPSGPSMTQISRPNTGASQTPQPYPQQPHVVSQPTIQTGQTQYTVQPIYATMPSTPSTQAPQQTAQFGQQQQVAPPQIPAPVAQYNYPNQQQMPTSPPKKPSSLFDPFA